jgi:CBS domain-containing protein
MKAQLVRDAMTKDVVTVRSFAPFREIVQTMVAHDLGAIPVVDSMGHAVGIVSRTDLIAGGEAGRGARARARKLLSRRGRQARARRAATTAARLMATDLVTVRADAGVARAVYLMQRHAVTHLPVVDEHNVVVGILARADLLRAFLRDDAEIREDVIRDVLIEALDADRDTLEVTVGGGVVTLSGTVDQASTAAYAVRLAREVPGVIDVVGRLHWRVDDSGPVGAGRT